MDAYPLHREMNNGATVKDWLGTAACAARVAAMRIERVREHSRTPREDLIQAERDLQQALEEVRLVRAEAER